ncbi:protein-disulfide reductase DsbD family protein [Candidatus Neomarinimicrobiota bacterium]
MNMKTILTGILIFTTFLFGQFNDPVSITASVKKNVRAGEVIEVQVIFSIDRGWHIYGMEEIENGPIPTSIQITGEAIDKQGIIIEPEPIVSYDEGFEMDIPHHDGRTKFIVPIKLKDNIESERISLTATATYQSCNNTICYPPIDQSVEIDLLVEPGEARADRLNLVEETKIDVIKSDLTSLDSAMAKGFWSFILLAASMGFLALLTPCVFPMIPITVSFFTQQGETSGKKPIKNALVYALGIITTFTLLGFLLAVFLGASGANQLASSPWVNLFIGALFIFFALSLFGMYEIQVPAKLRNISMQQEKRSGYIGILFMALTFTLASFTCTVQFVGLLLVAAAQGQWFWPMIGMIVFSTAFALPFFFLAMFPQYLTKLPKSGGWLNSVKVVLGFLVFAVAFKFIGNVDLVWSWGIFTHSVVLAIWTVSMIFTGIYLLGKIRLPHDSPVESIGAGRMILSLFFIVFGIYLGTGLIGRPINGTIASYLPPKVESESGIVMTGKDTVIEAQKWFSEMNEAIAEAKRTGKPIFLSFSGYTCTNCHWMDANILSQLEIRNLLEQFVLVKLYTDGGKNHREKRQYEIDRFGTAAQPFYVILNGYESEIARFPGMTRSVKEFKIFLNKGLE